MHFIGRSSDGHLRIGSPRPFPAQARRSDTRIPLPVGRPFDAFSSSGVPSLIRYAPLKLNWDVVLRGRARDLTDWASTAFLAYETVMETGVCCGRQCAGCNPMGSESVHPPQGRYFVGCRPRGWVNTLLSLTKTDGNCP